MTTVTFKAARSPATPATSPAQLALFGPSASDPSRAYYSYDLGAWHVVVLNAACYYYAPGCSEAGQEQWLRADLASHPAQCTLAYFHNPLFTSGSVHAGEPRMQRYWNALYEHGAEIILNGHNHQYERFAPQDSERRGRPGTASASSSSVPAVRASTASGRSRRTARFETPARTGSSSSTSAPEATTGSSSLPAAGRSPTPGATAATAFRARLRLPRLRHRPPPPPPPPPPPATSTTSASSAHASAARLRSQDRSITSPRRSGTPRRGRRRARPPATCYSLSSPIRPATAGT